MSKRADKIKRAVAKQAFDTLELRHDQGIGLPVPRNDEPGAEIDMLPIEVLDRHEDLFRIVRVVVHEKMMPRYFEVRIKEVR